MIDSIGVPMASRKRRILVIDDDDSVADTLAMVLNFSGFEATAVYSGEQALDLARVSPSVTTATRCTQFEAGLRRDYLSLRCEAFTEESSFRIFFRARFRTKACFTRRFSPCFK